MDEIQIFKNEEFGEIRTVTIDGEPWMVGKDVAEILGYAEPRSAVSKKVDMEDKGVAKMETPSGTQEMTVINESGLYSLVLSSKLPNAKKFKRWVTSEVLPSIRKTGSYGVVPKGKELLALAVLEAQKTIEEQTAQIEDMKPKALFAEAVAASGDVILIGELAKILKQNGCAMGQNRLFAWLRKNGYLISRQGQGHNMPTQKAMDLQVFRIKERTINNPDGSVRITKTVLVTGKGQQYFINKFLKAKESEENEA